MATLEVQLDYAEDETEPDLSFPAQEAQSVVDQIERLLATYSTGRLYGEGARIVLAGPVNAGKSSLFNYMLREERAIVSPVEGTTRDFIEGQCSIRDIPVRLYDTAGLRETENVIEKEGVQRSLGLLESADLILYLVQCDSGETTDVQSRKNCITVYSKTDLQNCRSCKKDSLCISVVTGEGIDKLYEEIERRLTGGLSVFADDNLVIQSARQKDCLDRAACALKDALKQSEEGFGLDVAAIDVREALDALGEITGEVTTEDILDNIFSRFCVGK